MDGIKAHCMGMEFPKRDTDSPNVRWLPAMWDEFSERSHHVPMSEEVKNFIPHDEITRILQEILPSAADLDAVAEEQRVKEKTSAQVPNR